MAQSLAKILLHTVFSTKDRRPFHREELHPYLGGILTHLGCQPLIIGGGNPCGFPEERDLRATQEHFPIEWPGPHELEIHL